MDTGKFNKDLAFTFASLEDVDCFICEDPLLFRRRYEKGFFGKPCDYVVIPGNGSLKPLFFSIVF
jgi:hypothetical protein